MAGRPLDRGRMRRDLHARAAVPALYRASAAGEWQALAGGVRIANREPVGVGEPEAGAQRREIAPRLILLVEDVAAPARDALVSVAAGEAYRLGSALPVEGLTVTVEATRLSAAQAAGLPVPD